MQAPRKAAVRFRERSELLDFLLEVSAATQQTLDLDELLANVAQIVTRVIHCELFAILLYSEKRRDLRIRYALGHREEIVRNLSLGLGEGLTGAAAGLLACAVLLANNLRDIAGDIAVGKRTLATRLGDRGTRVLYVALVGTAAAGIVATAALTTPWALLALAMLAVLVRPLRAVWGGARGPALIGVLKLTGIGEVIAALGLFVGVWLS